MNIFVEEKPYYYKIKFYQMSFSIMKVRSRFDNKGWSVIMKSLLCQMMLFAGITVFAQTRHLTGIVTDEEGQVVAGASVLVDGTTKGTTTDVNGSFMLDLETDEATLVVSFIGYQVQEVPVLKTQGHVEVQLISESLSLDEVVVVGYGEQSRRFVTSSIAKLDGESLQNIPISTVGEGLKGKIAGLKVTQTNFTPGGGFSYQIRGGSSINGSNSPLILVDGVERNFSAINPNDIASIDVLKDAASSAIYGAKASNGIILVTTKRGGYNKTPRITFEANLAWQNTETEIDFLDAGEYIEVVRKAVAEFLDVPSRASDALSYLNGAHSAGIGNKPNGMFSTRYYDPETDVLPEGYEVIPDPINPDKMIMYRNTDWQDLLYNDAWWQNYYLGVDGGGERIRYSASLGYTDDQGVALSTGYNRINFKANIDVKVTKRLTAGFGVDFARTNTEEYANQRNTISRALSNPPTMNAYYDDGTPVEGYNSTSQSPLFYNKYYDRNNQKNYASLIGNLKWEILDGLSANVQGSFFHTDSKNTQFVKANVFDATRKSSWGQTMTERQKLEAFLSYDKTFFADHKLSVIGGYSYQKRNYETVSLAGSGATSDKVTTINGSSVFEPDDITSSEQAECQIGFFGRLNYDYKGKYLLTVTFREDGSSKFAKESRWGFFPGVSGGWVLTEEPWLNNVKQLNFLKLRASYGSTGNNASVGIYDAYGSYGANYMYNGHSGIKPSDMPNERLQWETSNQLDLGFETGLFDNRIYVSADFFDKRTRNLLYEQNLPNTTGFSKFWTNLGKVRFWGYELELTTRNIVKKNFDWESKLVMSYLQNTVLDLPENGIDKNRTGGIALGDGTFFGGIAEGEPLHRFYGYVATGIIETEEQALNANYDALSRLPQKGAKRVGDYEWADRNGDGQITTSDQFCLGVTVPPFTGGFQNTFRYYNWTLAVYLDWAIGHSIFDESYARYFYGTFTNNYALARDVLKAWKKPGDDTKYARFYANDSNWGNDNYNRKAASTFTYKGDYLCLREITLQYSMPSKLFKKVGLKGVTFTLSGNNLYYFTEVKGISPEAGTSSTYEEAYNNYPPIRRVSLGVRLVF